MKDINLFKYALEFCMKIFIVKIRYSSEDIFFLNMEKKANWG